MSPEPRAQGTAGGSHPVTRRGSPGVRSSSGGPASPAVGTGTPTPSLRLSPSSKPAPGVCPTPRVRATRHARDFQPGVHSTAGGDDRVPKVSGLDRPHRWVVPLFSTVTQSHSRGVRGPPVIVATITTGPKYPLGPTVSSPDSVSYRVHWGLVESGEGRFSREGPLLRLTGNVGGRTSQGRRCPVLTVGTTRPSVVSSQSCRGGRCLR